MKTRLVLRLAAVFTLGGALALIAMQRRAKAQFNEENQAMREQEQEAERLAQENAELPRLRTATAALETLRAEAKELEKLRAEVWRLRPQVQERNQLLAENQRLAALPKPTTGVASSLADMPGYIAAANFADAGLSKPEDTLQTFFHTMSLGNLKRALECMTSEKSADFFREINKLPEPERTEMVKLQTAIFRVKGYQIVTKETPGTDRIVLVFRTSLTGQPHRFTLLRLGNEWKLAF
jgi:hypothetical protein